MLHGFDDLDDAGVTRLGDGRVLVQTVDFFPPIVDDPRDFGRIAAANALSDCYAMGAEPFTALNIVGFPRKELPYSVLEEILAGGSEKLEEAGCALVGGHSVEDAEVKYGVVVTGIAREEEITSNGGAKVGDDLVLTKPIGMGAVTTALQRGEVDADVLRAATDSMATLNRHAALVVRDFAGAVHAATDVTGFGLSGHGSEIARASSVTLEFFADALPITLGARELAARGVLSGGAKRSRAHLAEHFVTEASVPSEIGELALDAETSGGLLVAIDPSRTAEFIARVGEPAARIGRVTNAGDAWIRLLASSG